MAGAEDTIAVESLIDAMRVFPGNKVWLLDAGDIVSDPQAGCESNRFLPSLVELVQQVDIDRFHVVVSHGPDEISQDDAVAQQRLFGRAINEALTGRWRIPAEDADGQEWLADLTADGIISLSDLVDYVHRRVRADSANTQTPWLISSDSGLVESDQKRFPSVADVALFHLAKPNKKEQDAKSKEPTASVSAEAVAGNSTSILPERLLTNWKAIDGWLDIKDGNAPFSSVAEQFPSDVRVIQTRLLNREQFFFAGLIEEDRLDFTVEPPAAPGVDREGKNKIQEVFFGNKSDQYDPGSLDKWKRECRQISEAARASLIVHECRLLALRLQTTSPSLATDFRKIAKSLDDFLEKAARGEIATTEGAASESYGEFKRLLEKIVATPDISRNPITIESLLQCPLLSSAERDQVWRIKRARLASKSLLPTSLPLKGWKESPKPSGSAATSIPSAIANAAPHFLAACWVKLISTVEIWQRTPLRWELNRPWHLFLHSPNLNRGGVPRCGTPTEPPFPKTVAFESKAKVE